MALKFEFASFTKKVTGLIIDHFHANDLYGKIKPNKEPIKMYRFTSRLPCHTIKVFMFKY